MNECYFFFFCFSMAMKRSLSGVEEVLNEELAGTVGRAHKRTAGGVTKAKLVANARPMVKACGCNVLVHLHVAPRGLHILAQRQAIDTNSAQV